MPAITLEGRFLAAVLACGPRAVLSHRSAAALWGFLDWEERLIEVTVPGTAARVVPGVRAHRSWDAETTRHRGIRVTTPARTLLDLASSLPPRGLRRATRKAQAEQRVNHRQLVAALANAKGRRGAARLRALIADGPAPTRSELEDVVLDLLAHGGIERPEVNTPLILDAKRVIPDFLWRSDRLVLEADGAKWHDGRLAREDDAERQALLEAHGYRVLRVAWAQAVRRPEQTLARIRHALSDVRGSRAC